MSNANKLGALGVLISDATDAALGELSPSAAALLLTLHQSPNLTVTQLAKVAAVAQPTAVRLLDGLVRRGWVDRHDRIGRTVPLALTEAGATRAQSLLTARLKVLDRLLAALPEPDQAAFERAVDQVLAAATTSRAFARTVCRMCDHTTCDGPRCPVGTRATEIERQSERNGRC
ncbi:MAG TPA: MarR family transcriptional regulator [Aliidongia sp.]|uniref:MarR family winged helix-turn-helix transcriptional regulator n=1 Tax=Aliidongia sp. TaxID=1914230 RepID=UPI002DDD1191|nr:MarR family transcriptional regulator [Aliidongia sp.]HEV2674523.1 MarR family transcriptional regulator [Aliidongia sp.]